MCISCSVFHFSTIYPPTLTQIKLTFASTPFEFTIFMELSTAHLHFIIFFEMLSLQNSPRRPRDDSFCNGRTGTPSTLVQSTSTLSICSLKTEKKKTPQNMKPLKSSPRGRGWIPIPSPRGRLQKIIVSSLSTPTRRTSRETRFAYKETDSWCQ